MKKTDVNQVPVPGCAVCGEPADQRIVVSVNGEPLDMSPILCNEHGSRFLLRCGAVFATLHKPMAEVFK